MIGINMKSNKDLYREFSENREAIPIFSKGWWLDAVCGKEEWDVILIKKNNNIIASMPYLNRSNFLFKTIKMPQLTQNMGINIVYPTNQKLFAKYSYERKIIQEIIELLPKFDWFQQSFHHSFNNWLPFCWNNFKQTTSYTYILKTQNGLDEIFDNLKPNIRREMRKAEKNIKITESNNIEILYKLNAESYKKHNSETSYQFQTLKNIYNSCVENDSCKLYFATDNNSGKIVSAHLYIWDANTLYYLIGGSDISQRNSGAASLLMWEGIKLANKMEINFDFEGSMKKSIERYFSSFGAYQVPYMKMEKINSKIIKIKRALFN
jgi:lipid II:glycine glycyltransferase (peptidoglycan interpeptide bridge formation enzyme)